jgi:hypothetical protein
MRRAQRKVEMKESTHAAAAAAAMGSWGFAEDEEAEMRRNWTPLQL